MNIAKINASSYVSQNRALQTNISFGRGVNSKYNNCISSCCPAHEELVQSELEQTKRLVQENLLSRPPLYGYSQIKLPNGITREDVRINVGGESKYYKNGCDLPYITCEYDNRLKVMGLCVDNGCDFITDYGEV